MINIAYTMAGIIFHIMDMAFTLKLIEKSRWKFKNPEILEMNFHRIFFQKIKTKNLKWASLSITLPLIVFLYQISNTAQAAMLTGILLVPAYTNFRQLTGFDEIHRKVIYSEEYKNFVVHK